MSEDKHNHFNMDIFCDCKSCKKGREEYKRITEKYFEDGRITEAWYLE